MPDRGISYTVGNPLSDIAPPQAHTPPEQQQQFSEGLTDDEIEALTMKRLRERKHVSGDNSHGGGVAFSRTHTSLPSTIRRVYRNDFAFDIFISFLHISAVRK